MAKMAMSPFSVLILTDEVKSIIYPGTVGSVEEAIQWLKYTYLWVRMQKNPLLYGINQKMRERDPDLHHVSLLPSYLVLVSQQLSYYMLG
jgi:hypothetical protein